MNAKTIEILGKVEMELKEAKKQLEKYDPFGANPFSNCVGSAMHYNHWKRIALDLMRERREIKTGKKSW